MQAEELEDALQAKRDTYNEMAEVADAGPTTAVVAEPEPTPVPERPKKIQYVDEDGWPCMSPPRKKKPEPEKEEVSADDKSFKIPQLEEWKTRRNKLAESLASYKKSGTVSTFIHDKTHNFSSEIGEGYLRSEQSADDLPRRKPRVRRRDNSKLDPIAREVALEEARRVKRGDSVSQPREEEEEVAPPAEQAAEAVAEAAKAAQESPPSLHAAAESDGGGPPVEVTTAAPAAAPAAATVAALTAEQIMAAMASDPALAEKVAAQVAAAHLGLHTAAAPEGGSNENGLGSEEEDGFPAFRSPGGTRLVTGGVK